MSAKCSLPSRPAPVRRWDRRRGFTLVEVLVVVGILILLASILVPMVSKARAQASRAKCANTLRGLGQAISAFSGEHNATLPTCGADQPTYGKSTDWIGWGGNAMNGIDSGKMTDYMNESGLAKYLGFGTPDQSNAPNENLRKLYRCASVTDDQRATAAYKYDYQFNIQLSGMPLDRVEKAAAKPMVVETDTHDDSAFIWWTGTPPTNSANSAKSPDALSGRHGGHGDNCLYADGHVDILDPQGGKILTDHNVWDAYYNPATPAITQPQNTGYGAAN